MATLIANSILLIKYQKKINVLRAAKFYSIKLLIFNGDSINFIQ